MRVINYFEQIYAVNLPERTDRRHHIEKELTKLGRNSDKDKIHIFPALKFEDKGEFPKVSTRGCVMSHFTILNMARQNNLNNVLILQDDCSISKRFWQHEEKIINELANTSWDIAYLGHGSDVPAQSDRYFITANPSEAILLTHFCAFNSRVIPRLLDFMEQAMQRPAGHPEGGPMYLDGFISFFRSHNPDIVTLLGTPSFAWQASSRSDLNPMILDRYSSLHLISEKLRAIKNYYKYIFS